MAKKLTVIVLVLGSTSFMGPLALFAEWDRFAVSAGRDGREAVMEREETAGMAITIEEAQEELTPQVMTLPGVVGIAIGDCGGKACIKVLVAEKTTELMGKIPSMYKGYRVAVDEVGEIRGPRPIP